MFKNSYKILFYSMMMMSTMITISSTSWFGAWMGLEINLLSFIPLMNDNKNLMSNEASLKYFLIQAMASLILLFSVIIMLIKFNWFNDNINNNMINMIMLSTLLLKSGTAPFHFWFPMVMEEINWINALILMTWQKIAPLMLISYFNLNLFIIIIIIITTSMGSLGGLNQTSLKKIMAFSSINHLGWLLSAMMISEMMWIFYFIIYCTLSLNMIYMFNIFKLISINQMFSLNFNNKIMKFILFFNFLSLGGLPPFLGFIPKWFVIQYLIMNNQMILTLIIIFMTLITLYFYIRLTYSAFMINYYENNWNMKIYFNKSMMNIFLLISFFSSFMLPVISMIFYIY